MRRVSSRPVLKSRTSNACGKLFCLSDSEKLFCHVKPKMRTGVWNDAVVLRWLAFTCALSNGAPFVPGVKMNGAASMFRFSVLLSDNCGDHRNHWPMLTGFEETLRFGKFWSISLRPVYCVRVPPMLRFAGPNACWKLTADAMAARACATLNACCRIAVVLLEQLIDALRLLVCENCCWCDHEMLVLFWP